MASVRSVREALILMRDADTPIWPNRPVEKAVVVLGIDACDEYESAQLDDDGNEPGYHDHVRRLLTRVDTFACILRKAGLL